MKPLLLIISSLFFTYNIIAQEQLPRAVLYKIVTQINKFVLNSSTQFAHVDLPSSKYQEFFSFIKDSTANLITDASNPIYYKWYLNDGSEINGDLFFKDNKSYMVFKIDDKKYINYFIPEGFAYLKQIFKF